MITSGTVGQKCSGKNFSSEDKGREDGKGVRKLSDTVREKK